MSSESLEVAASFCVSCGSAPEFEPDASSPFLLAFSSLDSELCACFVPDEAAGVAAELVCVKSEPVNSRLASVRVVSDLFMI